MVAGGRVRDLTTLSLEIGSNTLKALLDESSQSMGQAVIDTKCKSATRQRPSSKRFVVLGGPGGYLTCRPAGCPMLRDRYRGWVRLFTVNRPNEPRFTNAAKDAALRCFTS